MDTSHTGLRSVPQLLYPGHQLHLSPPQNPELGLTPGPLGYGGGQSWSWHTADWWSHWEREKPVDQHHPETTSLNKLNRRWQRESWRRVVVQKTKHPNSVCVCLHSGVRVTCCVLIPDFDGAVMGGCCYLSGATRRHWEKHAAGCGLKVASVLHYFTAWLAQVPELITQTQLHWEQKAMSEVSKQSAQDTGYVRTHQRFQGSVEDKVSLHEGQHCVVARRGVFLK